MIHKNKTTTSLIPKEDEQASTLVTDTGTSINTSIDGTLYVSPWSSGSFTTIDGAYSMKHKFLDVGSNKYDAKDVSAMESITDAQWVTLMRKHVQLFIEDKELTNFLMEDALRNK